MKKTISIITPKIMIISLFTTIIPVQAVYQYNCGDYKIEMINGRLV